MGSRFFIGKNATEIHQTEVFAGISGLKVFENHSAFPRVFAVHKYVRAESEQHLRTLLGDGGIDLRTTALLDADVPPLENCAGKDSVVIERYDAEDIQISANMACTGILIFTDTWFPGWKAYVDGAERPIFRAYGLVRGLVVPRGIHNVKFEYVPLSLWLGLLGSLIGILLSAGLIALKK
jgi:hypothetical protein